MPREGSAVQKNMCVVLQRSWLGHPWPINSQQTSPWARLHSKQFAQFCMSLSSVSLFHWWKFIHGPVKMKMAWWCIRLTCLTLVCEVIRYCLVQVRQILKKKDFLGWRPAITFLYLFLFHPLLRLSFFLSENKNQTIGIGVKRLEWWGDQRLVCWELIDEPLYCLQTRETSALFLNIKTDQLDLPCSSTE